MKTMVLNKRNSVVGGKVQPLLPGAFNWFRAELFSLWLSRKA